MMFLLVVQVSGPGVTRVYTSRKEKRYLPTPSGSALGVTAVYTREQEKRHGRA